MVWHIRRPAVLALAALCGLAACTAKVSESSLLHPVAGGTLTQEALDSAVPGFTVTRHDIVAPDGARLHGVHLRRPGAKATILYFGGNGYTVGRFGSWTASVFAPLGVDLILVDHRGYGLSEGTPSVGAMEGDSLAAFDFARELAGPERAIVVHGHSLGSFFAGHVGANRPAQGVVLESSATTTEDWVEAGTPGIAKLFIKKVEIDPSLRGRGNLSVVPRIDEPLLLLVGAKDGTTPPILSQGLYDASPLPEGSKTLHVVTGAGHTDVMTKAGAIAAYRAFLTRLAEPAS